ncbi:Type 11 family methyltransferase [Sulfitobacter noctilucicola]|uniref:SAM-dependent methyltransferase n=1 Tax=Sulfitobacter noctilucicola TaxID=1342301 RepID=A0A7W6M6V7_9RHOB|nr:class I SAM-dependent methyltransferase [Sulfitobacter noctilucicola]KIN61944.1 Type 11 family methyltransferase [Sulfitobacter noctilucicola]MBB4173535.1 SAM-dependent methyltransferase [Sulfitobacter noctilucicola]
MTDFSEVTAKNRAAWDASAPHHGQGDYWQELRAGFADATYSRFDSTLSDALIAAGIKGGRAVQIGCNNGREVLSACALGAKECWGIDQSAAFLAQAAILRDISGHPARFLEADIYDLPKDCPTGFDVAFITIGVLNWMPDLPAFFDAVTRLLRDGGRLVIYETHPVLEMFDPEAADPMRPTISYFRPDPFIETGAITYDGSTPDDVSESHWFIHPLGVIVQSCLDAGLALTGLREFPHSIREVDYDIYAGQDVQIPMSFMLQAVKVP